MGEYDGFRLRCGCACARCGHPVVLEGYADAAGKHYCRICNEHVSVVNTECRRRTPEGIRRRQGRINRAGVE